MLLVHTGSMHGSAWADYRDVVSMPGSIIEDEMNRILEARIALELEHLPALVVSGLWFSTSQANDLLFEVQWALEHHKEVDSVAVEAAETDHRQHVVEHVRQLLYGMAEREAMQKD